MKNLRVEDYIYELCTEKIRKKDQKSVESYVSALVIKDSRGK